MNKLKSILFGIATGMANALFGAGGGLIAVTAFKSQGFNQRSAQAHAIAVILPLCFISACVYAKNGYYNISDALPYLPFGLLGAFAGAKLLKRIPNKLLKKIFALFMIYTGIRMLMR